MRWSSKGNYMGNYEFQQLPMLILLGIGLFNIFLKFTFICSTVIYNVCTEITKSLFSLKEKSGCMDMLNDLCFSC